MVNHLRTLLLNSRRPTTNLPPWDRYMDPAFLPVVLPSYLETTRKALLGTSDDWWATTLRVEAILSAVSSERYNGAYKWHDGRETSMPANPFYIDFATTLTPRDSLAITANAAVVSLPFEGTIDVYRRWQLSLTSAEYLTVEQAGKSTAIPFTPTAAIAPDIAIDVTNKNIGATWSLVSISKPNNWLTTVNNNLRNLPATVPAKLFEYALPEEQSPMFTYRGWWKTSEFEDDRLAAITFAYIRKVTALMN